MTASDDNTDRAQTFGSPEYNACPYAFYDTARTAAPAYEIPDVGAFLVTRYDAVLAAAKTPEAFSSHRPKFGAGDPELEAIMAEGYPSVAALVTADPPEHTRYRKLVTKPFTARAVTRHEALIRSTVTELIDSFIDTGEFELLTDFAVQLPIRVIGPIMGVPSADQPNFGRWADVIAESVSGYLPRERSLECARELVAMQRYFAALVEERRASPGDDLISELLTAEEDAERPLDMPEILELIRIFLAGGTESTASLLGSAFYLLLTHPEQFAQVRADHTLIPAMLEETLRLESPVQWNPRMVENPDVSLDGVAVPVGSRVLLSWGAANRDPAQFGPDADEFNIHRPRAPHVAFGHAFHFCLGAPLARLEAKIACEQLLSRLGDIELAVPAEELTFVGHGVVRRVASLPLRFRLPDATR
ncbi:MAG TPA: cytochrome P450 [Mycobacterium sp.]